MAGVAIIVIFALLCAFMNGVNAHGKPDEHCISIHSGPSVWCSNHVDHRKTYVWEAKIHGPDGTPLGGKAHDPDSPPPNEPQEQEVSRISITRIYEETILTFDYTWQYNICDAFGLSYDCMM